MALKAAVRDVSPDPYPTRSVFAELRRRHPRVAPQVLSKPSLVALSHAIEDECCARAAQPLLFGGFQHEQHLRSSAARWAELAGMARRRRCVRRAFPPRSANVRQAGPGRSAPDAPLTREWLVVCDAVELPACMAAVPLPGQGPRSEHGRRFEMLWSVDPRVVRDASRVAQSLADEYAPGWRPAGLRVADDTPRTSRPISAGHPSSSTGCLATSRPTAEACSQASRIPSTSTSVAFRA